MRKPRKFDAVDVILSILTVLCFSLWVWWQLEERYLYDTNFLHANGLFILASTYPVSTIVAYLIREVKLKYILCAAYFYGTPILFLTFVFLQIPFTSETNDFSDYKKFDLLVQSDVADFFPDDLASEDVIRYEYFYSNPYHHVYSVYLEIRVDDDYDEFISKYKTDDCVERAFRHDDGFIELVFLENVRFSDDLNQLERGDIRTILYSSSERIVIFEVFQSWSYCNVEDVYYFKRFDIVINDYVAYLES